MQTIATDSSNIFNKTSVMPEANLRAFRNKFLKYYIRSGSGFSAEDLSALLLYIALSFIENKKGLAKLFEGAVSANKKLGELNDSEIFLLGNEFLELLGKILPVNISNIIIAPGIVSWRKAKQFFNEPSKGALFDKALFADIANLGFAYQIFNSSANKESALAALQKANKKITKEELVAFTQLYTPAWVVDFLVANTVLSKKDKQNISDRYSRWLIPDQSHTSKDPACLKDSTHPGDPAHLEDLVRLENLMHLQNLSLLDPACGAGQFLFSAFDLLLELYVQNGYEWERAAKLILEKNLFGADIDEKALWVCGLGLFSKYLTVCDSIKSIPERLNNLAWVSVSDTDNKVKESSFLGSIDNRLPEKHFLKNQHSVVLTNPPYIGRRCLSRELKESLKKQYPNSCADLSAAFLERCLALLKTDGKLGIITQSSIMSIPSYRGLRDYLLNHFYMQAAIHCGPGVFPLASGEKIDSILLLITGSENSNQSEAKLKTCFADLSREKNKFTSLENTLASLSLKFINQFDFLSGIPDNLLSQLSVDFYTKINKLAKLGDIADIRQGLATTDNGRFVRYHFDVDDDLIANTWVPYIKGAGGERYASNNSFVVKWGKDGSEIKEAVVNAYPYLKGKTAWVVKNEDYYFRSGLCFSFINKSGLAVRRLPVGAIFDVASSAIFPAPDEEDFLLAYLNSGVIGLLAKGINQTINIQVGDLKKIPIIPMTQNLKNEIAKLGNLAFETKSKLLNCALFKLEFTSGVGSAHDLSLIFEDYLKANTLLQEKLFHIQAEIDNKVIDAMENQGIINSLERQFLAANFHVPHVLDGNTEPLLISERQFAFKLLNTMVSKAVSISVETVPGDCVMLLPLTDNQALSKLFNLTKEGMCWLEDKLEAPIAKFFSRSSIVDISKLAQEPSRYFVFYLRDYNACMLFSSSAARCFKKLSCQNLFIAEELASNSELLNTVNTIWQSAFEKLDKITDWTSKDLKKTFQSIKDTNY